MKNLAEYISNRDHKQRELFFLLNEILMNHKEMRSAIRYGIPFYGINRWICYLSPKKNDAIEICFLQGKKLNEIYPFMDMKSRKMVSGMLLENSDDFVLEQLENVLLTAIELDKKFTSGAN